MTALLLLLLASPLSAQELVDARVVAVEGDVTLYAGGAGDGVAAEEDAPLEEGDRLVTGAGGSVDIALDGGSIVTISQRSDFTLHSSRAAATVFTLNLGRLLAKIKQLAGDRSLEVRSPTAVAAVRGTEFAVEVGDEKQTDVAVFDEGKVEVTGQTGDPVTLGANQETRVAWAASPEKARALRRMMRHRAHMRGAMRERLKRLAQRWQQLPPERRRELRGKMLERMRQRRAGQPGGATPRERLERVKERREQRRERRQQRRERPGQR